MAEGMDVAKDEWWVSRSGQRFGPVTFATLVESARAGRIEPRSDLVLGPGMEDWVPAGEVDGVFERREAAVDGKPAGGHQPPAVSMADSGGYDFGQPPTKLDLPGATRLGYILGTMVLPMVLLIGMVKMLPEATDMAGPELGPFVPLLLLLLPVLVLVITVKRFQNLGMTGWWCLGLMVPFMNWWLGYRLLACPPGYVHIRKLDVWGWILAVLYWLVIVGSLVASILFGALGVKELMESGEWQQILNTLDGMKESAGAR